MTAVLERDGSTTITWAAPDTDLWVASLGGDYGGMVEFREGRFSTSSSTGQHLGDFVSLHRAKNALETGPAKTVRFPYVATVAASAIVSTTAIAFTAFAVL